MKREKANRRLMVRLSIFAVAMFGFGFALVPFYEKICEVTGINNLIKPAAAVENTQVDKTRWVTLEFDANSHGLEWDFRPVQRSVRVHPGEMIQIEYEVKNNGDKAIVGQAIPSYGPKHAAPFVKKLECFCFTQQPLQAGEGKRMPVQFVIDSTLPADLSTITLSYTFFEVKGASTAPARGGQG
ncbi:MAG: cytochrome c oxidase assembly protein [Burkholderiales bacterium]|jgi:cytochrome c oxidase assembly protein subunit 11|nr:cytochrome c oxidase assembly protein [Burkholderiales bacterium]